MHSTLHGHPGQTRVCIKGAWRGMQRQGRGPWEHGRKLWDLQASQGSLDRLVSRMRPTHMQRDGHVGMSSREQTGIKEGSRALWPLRRKPHKDSIVLERIQAQNVSQREAV